MQGPPFLWDLQGALTLLHGFFSTLIRVPSMLLFVICLYARGIYTSSNRSLRTVCLSVPIEPPKPETLQRPQRRRSWQLETQAHQAFWPFLLIVGPPAHGLRGKFKAGLEHFYLKFQLPCLCLNWPILNKGEKTPLPNPSKTLKTSSPQGKTRHWLPGGLFFMGLALCVSSSFFFFLDRVSLCNPGWTRTYLVDQATGSSQRSASAGIKALYHHAWHPHI